MGYMNNICIGAAVVGSAFAGYFLYKKLVKLYQDEPVSSPSTTEEDANQVVSELSVERLVSLRLNLICYYFFIYDRISTKILFGIQRLAVIQLKSPDKVARTKWIRPRMRKHSRKVVQQLRNRPRRLKQDTWDFARDSCSKTIRSHCCWLKWVSRTKTPT